MSPAVRKVALVVHVAISVGWLGSVSAYLALDLSVATAQDPHTLRAGYAAMAVIAGKVIVPFAFGSLGTGLLMSLGTTWGLFRHYWVVISLLLTIIATAVLLGEVETINHLARMAADPTTSAADLRTLGSTLAHSAGGTLVLLVILALNMYKPKARRDTGGEETASSARSRPRGHRRCPEIHARGAAGHVHERTDPALAGTEVLRLGDRRWSSRPWPATADARRRES